MKPEKAMIIHIITKLELGGAQQTTLYILRHLDQAHYIPILICGPGGILTEDAEEISGVRLYICKALIRTISPYHDLLAFIALVRMLRKEKKAHKGPIIVHTHSSKAGILGRWASLMAGIHIRIHTCHGFGFNPYQPLLLRWLFILAERVTGMISTRIVYVSRDNLNTGIKRGISNTGNSCLIRSGVDWDRFSSKAAYKKGEVRKGLMLPENGHIIGMIACLKPQKAPLDFIHMAWHVNARLPDACFLLIGDGALRVAVEDEIKKLGLSDKVRLTGWRRDIPRLMCAMDVMVLTSLWEGLPKVVIEAGIMGVPVVVTRTSGVEEVVRDGITGHLVPPARPDLIAERVVELLKGKKIKKGIKGESVYISKEFDLREVVKRHDELYQDLIKA